MKRGARADAAALLDLFPRSSERGPIEAPWSRSSRFATLPRFHAHPSVVSRPHVRRSPAASISLSFGPGARVRSRDAAQFAVVVLALLPSLTMARSVSSPKGTRGCGRLGRRWGSQRWLRRPEESAEQSIPLRDVSWFAGRLLAGPGEGRGEPVEVLVRARMVVPGAEESEIGSEVVWHAGLVEPAKDSILERGEEPFDSPVLPGSKRSSTPMADAKEAKRVAEEPGGEGSLVVGEEDSRASIAFDGVEQGAKQRDRRTRAQLAERQTGPRAVVDQAEDRSRPAGIR